jgi:hypothetical protein
MQPRVSVQRFYEEGEMEKEALSGTVLQEAAYRNKISLFWALY